MSRLWHNPLVVVHMQTVQSVGECYNPEFLAGIAPLLSFFELQDGFPKMEMVMLDVCKRSGLCGDCR
jgi:hypothetical protein